MREFQKLQSAMPDQSNPLCNIRTPIVVLLQEPKVVVTRRQGCRGCKTVSGLHRVICM